MTTAPKSAPAFNTVGKVAQRGGLVTWIDLDAFTQGYVEAILRGPVIAVDGATLYAGRFRFTDIAWETLERARIDCKRRSVFLGPDLDSLAATRAAGAAFWRQRNDGTDVCAPDFPPRVAYLNNADKVATRPRKVT